RPKHPYTRGLLSSVPRLDWLKGQDLRAIPGNPPNLLSLPEGCRFQERCPLAHKACLKPVAMRVDDDGHAWRCVLDLSNEEQQEERQVEMPQGQERQDGE